MVDGPEVAVPARVVVVDGPVVVVVVARVVEVPPAEVVVGPPAVVVPLGLLPSRTVSAGSSCA